MKKTGFLGIITLILTLFTACGGHKDKVSVIVNKTSHAICVWGEEWIIKRVYDHFSLSGSSHAVTRITKLNTKYQCVNFI